MGLPPSRGRWGICLALLALVGLSGCGGSTTTVKGKVYLDDKPLKGGNVTFTSVAGKGGDSSAIEEDGSYTIRRVPTGKVKIAVDTSSLNPAGRTEARKYEPPPGQKSPYGQSQGSDTAARYMPIPENYKDPEKSGLEFEVKGGSQTHDIKLTSSGGAAGGGAGQ